MGTLQMTDKKIIMNRIDASLYVDMRYYELSILAHISNYYLATALPTTEARRPLANSLSIRRFARITYFAKFNQVICASSLVIYVTHIRYGLVVTLHTNGAPP